MCILCWAIVAFLNYPKEKRHLFYLLQLNLKFEIEVLCKNLSLDINDLKPGNLLKDKEKLKNLEEQLSAPKKEAKPPEELLPVSTAGGYFYSYIYDCGLFVIVCFSLHQLHCVNVLCLENFNENSLLWPTGDFVPFAAPPSTPAATTTPCTTTGPPTPQFSYHDINVYALAGLAPHININISVSVIFNLMPTVNIRSRWFWLQCVISFLYISF